MAELTVRERSDMMYTISVDGSVKSVALGKMDLKEQLAQYNIVNDKCDALIGELANNGYASTEIALGTSK